MQGQDNIISFSGSALPHLSVRLNAKSQQVVSQSRVVVMRWLSKLMRVLFEQLDDTLYEHADRSSDNALQSSYFDAMRVLRKQRHFIDNQFVQQVLCRFDGYWQPDQVDVMRPLGQEQSPDAEMDLVTDDELEDGLAVANMIAKNENRYAGEISALGQRFFYLLSGGRQGLGGLLEKSPLEPSVICIAFQTAMRPLSIELPVKLFVYKHFENHLTRYLEELYHEMNQLLSRSGIMPQLKPEVVRYPLATSSRASATSASAVTGDSCRTGEATAIASNSSQASESAHDQVFSIVCQLLKQRAESDDHSLRGASIEIQPITRGSLPVVDRAELLSVLQRSRMLVETQLGQQRIEPANLQRQLLADLQLGEGGEVRRTLATADHNLIDVVSSLFEFILDDSTLPDVMKTLFSRLQIPMLKVAVIDKAFLTTKGHPARRLLNNMTQAAMVCDAHGARDNLHHKIASIIQRITDDFDEETTIFADLDREFSAWWAQEQQAAELAEQRTMQCTRGKDQLQHAKQIVVKELNQRLKKYQSVPAVVMEILQDGWKDVLLLDYLGAGPESDAWQDSLAIADRLLWSVLPKAVYNERQELLRHMPELLRNLRERLQRISFDQHKMVCLFKELQQCHVACLRGTESKGWEGQKITAARGKQISFPDSQVSASAPTGPLLEANDRRSVKPDRYTRQAEKMQLGTWLELLEGRKRLRLKLSWKSQITDTYIFVNRKGVKAKALNRQELAKRLREGSAQLLELPQAPIVDRALDAMLKTLKDRARVY